MKTQFHYNPVPLKKLNLHIFDLVDTALSNERELIVYSFLLDFSKGEGSSVQFLFCNAFDIVNVVNVVAFLLLYGFNCMCDF